MSKKKKKKEVGIMEGNRIRVKGLGFGCALISGGICIAIVLIGMAIAKYIMQQS